ncbi:MAG TPA: toxin [Tenuifilaceae bacterium]|nr:toxin [Tenuifilaceae bacterium]
MSKEAEVAAFLMDFKAKMKIWDVLFRDERGKNTQALVELELRPVERKDILNALDAKDYSEGPLEEKLYGGADMWVFGKVVKKREVYIKITMGGNGVQRYLYFLSLGSTQNELPFKVEQYEKPNYR